MSWVLLTALAAQGVAVTSSPAPQPAIVAVDEDTVYPIVAAPPPPPIVRTMLSGASGPANIAVPIRVRVTVRDRTLFDDTLRVSRGSSASYTVNRQEAPNVVCLNDRSYGSGERQSLSIQLYLQEDAQRGPGVNLSVNWQRPSGGGCPGEGTRTVAIAQNVPLAPGQSATVEGDGGLTVSLSRR